MSAGDDASAARVQIAIAVVLQGGQCLIGLRPAGTALAGLWEFPGGKVHPGETAEAAAVRECREETGLEVEVESALTPLEHDYAHAAVRLHFFRCRPQGGVWRGAAADLPARFRWVPLASLGEYQFPPANAAILAHLQAASC